LKKECPKCKSSNITKQYSRLLLFFILILSGIVLAWIGIYNGIIFVLGLGIFFFSPAAFVMDTSNFCKDCKHRFKDFEFDMTL
jgi:hypothetical protein